MNKIKQNLLNLVILVLAVIIAFKVYQSKEIKILALKNQKEMEKKKNGILSEISTLEKKLAYLKENINNKAPSAVLDKIGDFAKSASVKISQITPEKEIAMGVYTKYHYDMVLSASDYHQIGKFMNILENSPDIYMVENLVINSNADGEADSVTATLTVSTILITK
ncbi:MAG: type 4a pilus biogenesis protein PilO [bacterium]